MFNMRINSSVKVAFSIELYMIKVLPKKYHSVKYLLKLTLPEKLAL